MTQPTLAHVQDSLLGICLNFRQILFLSNAKGFPEA